jgi:histidinol phosphatase-like enzyme (inositol monophosphatase family)
MINNFNVPHDMIALANRCADLARPMALQYFRSSDLNEQEKNDKTLVTFADRAIEELIRDIVSKERPLDGIFGEEFGHTSPDAEWQWILDPIDGTKAFIVGRPSFGFLLGLYHAQHGFVYGLADQAYTKDRWQGCHNMIATLNNRPIHPVNYKPAERYHVAITNPTRLPIDIQAMHENFIQSGHLIVYGGDFQNYTGIADGSIHIVMESQQQIYDIAAMIPMITSSGGVITLANGDPLTLDMPKDAVILAACNQEVHTDILQQLRRYNQI